MLFCLISLTTLLIKQLILLSTGLTEFGYDKYGFNTKGIDVFRCTYYYEGPFASIQSYKIWQILSLQSPTFLSSLTRLCPALDKIPSTYADQFWLTDVKDLTSMIEFLKFCLTARCLRYYKYD